MRAEGVGSHSLAMGGAQHAWGETGEQKEGRVAEDEGRDARGQRERGSHRYRKDF